MTAALPSWIPWPVAVEPLDGEARVDGDAQVVASEPQLAPLARILSDEMFLAHGVRLVAADGRGSPHDIVLSLDPGCEDGSYSLSIDDRIAVRARDYSACAAGTVTLLQSLRRGGDGALTSPRCIVRDRPHASYRGILIDCARHPQSIDTLERVVKLCRFYKLGFLQLHLTDDEAFTFPSTRFPELATEGRSYGIEELRELERFARERGVTIIPEFDLPGHSGALVRANPELFGLREIERNPRVVHMGREATYRALDLIVGEMCAVFESSPWFHIGGDEVCLTGVEDDPDVGDYMRERGLGGATELCRHFLVRVHEIVRRHGKRTLCWEGFRRDGEVEVPRDIVVMAWESACYAPSDLIDDGYSLVNASWQPLYVVGGGGPSDAQRMWSPEHIYGWNMYRWEHFDRRCPTFRPYQAACCAPVIGAQLCLWEQLEGSVVPTLGPRAPAFAERLWNPAAGRSHDDFSRRQRDLDPLVERLLSDSCR